jgi:hypothetical protein
LLTFVDLPVGLRFGGWWFGGWWFGGWWFLYGEKVLR